MKENQKGAVEHIDEITVYHLGDAMIIDEATKRNLELVESITRKGVKGSLLGALDSTHTAMGARLLRHWICYPLVNAVEIQRRLQAVEELKDESDTRESLREDLKRVSDLERLNGKLALGQSNGRDLAALKDSLRQIPLLKEKLSGVQTVRLAELAETLDPLEDVCELIEKALVDDPPVSLKEGGLVREGYDEQLDQYIHASRDGKSWIASMEAREKKRTGINSLKVGFNKIFGYYLEITKANLASAPDDYIRKQTLVNGERFITEELKEYETLVLEAQEKRVELEYDLFVGLRTEAAKQTRRIKQTAGVIAELDILASLRLCGAKIRLHPAGSRATA